MSRANDKSSRTLTLKKEINAPVKLVWEAWTSLEHIVQWWGPPGMKVNGVEHDFKVGGKWKYTMQMPDGSQFISEGTYLEIETNKKIVTTADFKPMTEGVELHILFEAYGDKTNFTFSVIHASEEYSNQQEKMGFYNGWGSTFKRMETFITEQLKK